MFSLYLVAFAFLAPWRDAQTADSNDLVCDSRRSYAALLEETTPFGGDRATAGSSSEVTNRSEDEDDEGGTTLRNRQPPPPPPLSESVSRLSESMFVPIKDHSTFTLPDELTHACNHSRAGDGSSVADSEDQSEEEPSVRSVRFNRMAEVREMSSLDAPDALLARMSYSASLRLRRQTSHHKTARTALLFAVLVGPNFIETMCEWENFILIFRFSVVRGQLFVPVGFGAQRISLGDGA